MNETISTEKEPVKIEEYTQEILAVLGEEMPESQEGVVYLSKDQKKRVGYTLTQLRKLPWLKDLIVSIHENIAGLTLPDNHLTKEQKQFKTSDLGKALVAFLSSSPLDKKEYPPEIAIKNQQDILPNLQQVVTLSETGKLEKAYKKLYLKIMGLKSSTDTGRSTWESLQLHKSLSGAITDEGKLTWELILRDAWWQKYKKPLFPQFLNVQEELKKLEEQTTPTIVVKRLFGGLFKKRKVSPPQNKKRAPVIIHS